MSEFNDCVVVHYDKDGETSYFVTGDRVRLFVVDERAPNDRVYEFLSRDTPHGIKEILKDDPIGSSQDDRHAGIKARIEEFIDGKPRLTIVES